MPCPGAGDNQRVRPYRRRVTTFRSFGLAAVAAALLLTAAAPALATVHKCRAADGKLTYQQMPCAVSEQGIASDLPSEYPPPDLRERERILQREADLMRSLESHRDRLAAEAIARLQRPELAPAALEAVAIPVFVPLRAPRPRSLPRNAYREWSSGRLR